VPLCFIQCLGNSLGGTLAVELSCVVKRHISYKSQFRNLVFFLFIKKKLVVSSHHFPHFFTGLQEHCLPCKSKDNEEIWKMGNIGNSAEVRLLCSSLSISTCRTPFCYLMSNKQVLEPLNLEVTCKISTCMKPKIFIL